jgi:hypothetical protein
MKWPDRRTCAQTSLVRSALALFFFRPWPRRHVLSQQLYHRFRSEWGASLRYCFRGAWFLVCRESIEGTVRTMPGPAASLICWSSPNYVVKRHISQDSLAPPPMPQTSGIASCSTAGDQVTAEATFTGPEGIRLMLFGCATFLQLDLAKASVRKWGRGTSRCLHWLDCSLGSALRFSHLPIERALPLSFRIGKPQPATMGALFRMT